MTDRDTEPTSPAVDPQTVDPDVASRRFAHESLEKEDPTGWFERLYSAAEDGQAVVPWDRGGAHPLLSDWVQTAEPDGTGKQALVVGAGTGWDAELVADLGYETIAFDISPTAIETAKRAHPNTKATYQTADLLNPPADWHRAFDLVVEIYTVQALPIALQAEATKRVGEFVRVGGSLLVIAAARADDEPDAAVEGPPWPLTRAGIDAFAIGDLRLIQLDRSPSPNDPTIYRWRAEYLRD
ncbi:bifunctional 2-polyprenyl-6-hydroxyphenol methylase/3-demethylubiquinol 3-O-methyltransferase UbiG [Kribbella sp. VKM Ac-2568]|uniref:class I SAM-dependent methyltransferase n=1 Tax=Kribbella sp. VKM Ac-2568 TaxID=2512219 RepID=UPI00104F0AD7|nr:class I SAM-dependent methyltransferase [Kribbella sp. VKM Ac-2568]TCM38179.1 thiopurine S-methyltransferase [Kribbella sp. VKM Ac-2568]